MKEFNYTRKHIGEILEIKTTRPHQFIGDLHVKYRDLFIENIDYTIKGRKFYYNVDCVELFKLIIEENKKVC